MEQALHYYKGKLNADIHTIKVAVDVCRYEYVSYQSVMVSFRAGFGVTL